MTTLLIDGLKATYQDARWECSDASLARTLNALMPAHGFSASDPNPDQSAVDLVKAMFDVEILEVAEALDEEIFEEEKPAVATRPSQDSLMRTFLQNKIVFGDYYASVKPANGEVIALGWDVDKGVAMLDDEPTESFILRELAARWFLWSRDLLPESVAENPRALSESDAMEALENHLAAMGEANL